MLPGRSIGLYYQDDPGVWHEGLVVYQSSDGGNYILTPDGDLHSEDVMCTTGQGPSHDVLCDDGGGHPKDLKGSFYRFGHYPSDKEFQRMVMDKRKAGGDSLKTPAKVVTMTGKRQGWSYFANRFTSLAKAKAKSGGAPQGGPETTPEKVPRTPRIGTSFEVSLATP